MLSQALELIRSRDAQVENLLNGMEELNGEVEEVGGERDELRVLCAERELEIERLKQTLLQGVNVNDSTTNNDGSGGNGGNALSLAEREELIRLRSEVAEYEVEFRGLKNQDITIRKLESKIVELEENRAEEIQRELK